MADPVHRYYCSPCDRMIYGETLASLASAVNYHATAFHPADFANWTAGNIVSSTRYSPPPSLVLPQYTRPHGTTTKNLWGDAVKEPVLTALDRKMLKEGLVAWD